MTTSTPPELHEELAALDAIEQALAQLITADLEDVQDADPDQDPDQDAAAHHAAPLQSITPAQPAPG
jgi:hypothetical protein